VSVAHGTIPARTSIDEPLLLGTAAKYGVPAAGRYAGLRYEQHGRECGITGHGAVHADLAEATVCSG